MRKKIFRRCAAVLLTAALLTTTALAAGNGTGAAVYTNTVTLADGLTYRNQLSYKSSGARVETYALETAPGSSVYPIVLACDTIYGGMTISRVVSYAQSLGYNVVGAVNADFGYWSTKVPCGMVVENGIYKSSPEGNNAIAFTDGTAFTSFMPEVTITLQNETSGQSVQLTHYNKTRSDTGGLYLYSEYFSTVSTRTSGDGWFVRFRVLDGDMTVNGQMTLEVTELIHGEYSALAIGEDNLILTAADAADLLSDYGKFSVGDRVTLTTACSDERLAGADWVSGCGNILISESELFHPEWWDSSITAEHPRTVIGIRADGSVVYEVMDGRSENSGGATLTQLAQDMLSEGFVYAVNMDGGGSSALSLRLPGGSATPTVVNTPSDGSLRSVCSYILFVTDEPSSGQAERLCLSQDGAFVLAGASVDLGYLATDNTAVTVSAPADVAASAYLGAISGNRYTAQGTGVDTVTLSSPSAGASGSGTLHVIAAADTLTVTNAATGKSVTQADLKWGDTLSLAVSASYLGRDVLMDGTPVSWAVTGDIGTVSQDGVFTASGTPGASGTVTVTAAGITREIPVTLAFEFSDMRDHWAADYVQKLYDAGIVSGVTGTQFAPDSEMKRCDFLVMLYRAAGSPAVPDTASFSDVPQDAYYAAAAAWAKAQGIANGVTADTLDPQGTLTRQQGFAFLYRALTALGVTYTDGGADALAGFPDVSALADWAVTPAATLVKLGVVAGGDSGLEPGGTLTRAQMAKMLCKVLGE